MKSTAFRYGIYGMIAMVALSGIHFFLVTPYVNNSMAELMGYLTMLLSMIFVFTGIRYYRDKVNGGLLSFGQGIKTGLLIVLIPSVAFGLFDILYTEVLRPGWKAEYYQGMRERLIQSTAPEMLEAALKKLEQQKEMFDNPLFQFVLMAGTVFIIGLIVTIISSLALRRNKPAEAA